MDLLILGLTGVLLTIIQWRRDITREGTYQGLHTKVVAIGLRWGIILFIVSEVLFFLLFFLSFFFTEGYRQLLKSETVDPLLEFYLLTLSRSFIKYSNFISLWCD